MDKKKYKKILKIIAPILFGAFLIWLTFKNATSKEINDLINYIKEHFHDYKNAEVKYIVIKKEKNLLNIKNI